MAGTHRLRSAPDHAVDASPGSAARPVATQAVSMRSMSSALTGGGPGRSAVATMLPASAGNAMIARLLADEGPAAPGDAIAARITAKTGGGRPLPPDLRAEVEAGMGQQLGDVRIHDDAEAAELATQLGARAFTSGQDIFFNSGVYNPATPDGYEVLTHELTHTLQQSTGPVAGRQVSPGLAVSDPGDRDEQAAYATAARLTAARSTGEPARTAPPPAPRIASVATEPVIQRVATTPVQLDSVTAQRDGISAQLDGDSLIPDFILDGVKYAVSAIPGYTMLTQIIGSDPLTGQPVRVGHETLVEDLLTYGPFGPAVGPLLSTIDVLDDVFSTVSSELAAHNLTLERVGHEIESAWDELSITEGIDGNTAMLRRHVNAILDDAMAAVRALVDRVIEIVRSVIAEVAEPLLQTDEIAPVWNLARKVLHYDPLRGEEVSAPTVEILADFLRLIGQEQRLAQMTERGTLQQAADWLDTQMATFSSITGELSALFTDAWDAIQPANLPHLLDTLPALAQRAFALVRRIADFAATIIAKVLELVKQSLLGWLSEHAHELPGFHLLTVILGRNPFTGDPVPRTAENLIKGFITLMPGGEATYEQLAEAGVIGEAAARIESAMARLGISWDMVVGLFRNIWDGLSLDDLLNPIGAFDRILNQFGEPLGRLLEFVTEVIQVVITLILRLMNFPSDLLGSIIDNAMAAIEDIKRDPVAFLKNMLLALKNGFVGFLDEILTFLVQGLSAWLFRGLGAIDITMPADLSLQSVLTLVMQVLGVSVDMLWTKLGQHIGEERAAMLRSGIDRVQGAWAFIKDVQEHGVSAIWSYVVDQLGNLWDTIIGMAQNWIMTEIVQAVTARLISMLDPTGVMAVIRSVQALFNAIQSGIEYLRDILQIVNEYVTTFAQVAAGNVGPGAEKVKMGLAHAIPIAIGFLANQVGIGNVPEKIVEIIGGLREMIDQAIDWLFEQAMRLGAAALNALGLGGGTQAPSEEPTATGDVRTDTTNALLAALADSHTTEQVTGIAAGIEERFRPAGLQRIVVGPVDEHGDYAILVEASPLLPAVLLRVISEGYNVRAAATLTFKAPVDVGGPRLFYPARARGGGRQEHPDGGGNIMVGWGSEHAGVVSPTPGPDVNPGQVPSQLTTDVVQVVAKNAFVAANAKEDNNRTHAEVHLIAQITADLPDLTGLSSVDLRISRMPCYKCCESLETWLKRISPTVPITITWTTTHPTRADRSCNFPTSVDDISRLLLPNVTTNGPPPLWATQDEAIRQASRSASPAR